ncbi:MAG TPA: hypothetical protein VHV82_07920 [Sporichthyaceae bacterium]|nr:hypothetical protein [Sporichthyaceae bacterium]
MKVRRAGFGLVLFVVSLTVFLGLAYGASFVVGPARLCAPGCGPAGPPAMPVNPRMAYPGPLAPVTDPVRRY